MIGKIRGAVTGLTAVLVCVFFLTGFETLSERDFAEGIVLAMWLALWLVIYCVGHAGVIGLTSRGVRKDLPHFTVTLVSYFWLLSQFGKFASLVQLSIGIALYLLGPSVLAYVSGKCVNFVFIKLFGGKQAVEDVPH